MNHLKGFTLILNSNRSTISIKTLPIWKRALVQNLICST